MIVYLAGNFDLLIYYQKEKTMKEHTHSLNLDYNRLISFFEAHRINGILKLKKEYEDDKRKVRIRRRTQDQIDAFAAGSSE